MGVSFKRFKARIKLYSLLLSVSLGFGVGGLTAGALVLCYKLKWLTLMPWASVLIGVGVMLAVGAASLFVTYKSDRRVALALDGRLGLGERVRTMVDFTDSESDMALLQREDTEERLASLPTKTLKFKALWVSLVAIVLALSMLITSFAIPKKSDPPPYDPDFNMDTWQQTALKDLIRWVENSSVEQAVKGSTLTHLDRLLEELYEVEKLSEMQESVIGVMVAVDALVDRANSYAAIRSEIDSADDERLTLVGTAIGALGSSAEEEVFVEFRQSLGYDNLKDTVSAFNTLLYEAIEEAGYGESDMLAGALYKMAAGLSAAAELAPTSTNEETDLLLEAVFMTAATEINGALRQQSVNRSGANYVVARLADIFEIPAEIMPDLGDNDLPAGTGNSNTDIGDKDNEDKQPTDGGLGSGDTVWGSDDVIYCPSDNTYKPYGDMLIEYQAKILADIQDGKYTEEFAEMLLEYLDTLSSGIVTEED